MSLVEAVEIVAFDGDEVVKRVAINPPTPSDSRKLERVWSGILMNMDSERFYIRDVEVGEQT